MKVTAILKGRIDSNGHQPIQIRVAVGQTRTFYPTGIKVDPELWDAKAHRVKKEHPKAGEYNNDLKRLIIQYQAKSLEGGKKKVPKVAVYDYIEQCLIQWDKTKRSETLRQARSERTVLDTFAPGLLLQDITVDFCYKYQGYLYSIGNQGNTVWKHFKFLRTIVRKAVKEGLMAVNPFDTFPFPKYKDPKRVYLTTEEIDKLDNYLQGPECPAEWVKVGTWFLIACFTGLRRSDLLAFDKKKNIVGDRLIVHTVKTEDIVSLPISDRVRGYLERVEYKAVGFTGEYYNILLKGIMAGAGIDKPVTSHVARHTAGIQMAEKGISIEVAKEVLGQKKIATTQIYYKIKNKRIDDEYKRLS